MISSRMRGGSPARLGVALAVMAGLLVAGSPASADYSRPTGSYVAPDSSSYATPLDYSRVSRESASYGYADGTDEELQTIRKTVDLTVTTPLQSVRPSGYPTGPVYCIAGQYERPGCLDEPTVVFTPVKCVDKTHFELKIVATNTNRYGQLRGWAPVELAVNTNGSPFGDAALVPRATRMGPGVFEWTYYLPNGRTAIDAGYGPQPSLNFGSLVLGISCDQPRG